MEELPESVSPSPSLQDISEDESLACFSNSDDNDDTDSGEDEDSSSMDVERAPTQAFVYPESPQVPKKIVSPYRPPVPVFTYDMPNNPHFNDPPYEQYAPSTTYRPEQFGLPASIAEQVGCKAAFSIGFYLSARGLTMKIHQAVYFIQAIKPDIAFYVKTEMLPPKDGKPRTIYARGPQQQVSTYILAGSRPTSYNKSFRFEYGEENSNDNIYFSAWICKLGCSIGPQMLGCMSFSVDKLLWKAGVVGINTTNDDIYHPVDYLIEEGIFFTLKDTLGEYNFPQAKVKFAIQSAQNNSAQQNGVLSNGALNNTVPNNVAQSNATSHNDNSPKTNGSAN